MQIIDFVKEEYWLNKSHSQKGLESSIGSQEYIQTYEWLQQKNLYNFIEIGSAFGGSFHLWATLVKGKKISVDMEPRGQYPQALTQEMIQQRNNIWKKHFSNVYCIQGNSHDTQVVNQVEQILENDLVDWLFIDAEHTYEGAKQDYEMYKHLVKPGGYIAFHDIRMHKADSGNGGPGCGVFWDELIASKKYNYYEFADIIGVIQSNQSTE